VPTEISFTNGVDEAGAPSAAGLVVPILVLEYVGLLWDHSLHLSLSKLSVFRKLGRKRKEKNHEQISA
jgi:hypothetical protein